MISYRYILIINFCLKFYPKHHFKISFIYFFFLSLIFFNLGLIDGAHKWPDSVEYIQRSKNIDFLKLNFLGLSDGFRPPLFPTLLHFLSFFPFNLVIFYKILNISFLTLIPSGLIFISKDINDKDLKNALSLSAILYYFFLPNFFFIDFVYSELLTVLVMNLIVFITFKIYISDNYNNKLLVILCFLFLINFYLKANLILYGLLFIVFINKIEQNFKKLFFFGLLIIALLFPWFFYMHSITGEIKATNSQHINRLIGMGGDTFFFEKKNLDTYHGKYIDNEYGKNKEMIKNYRLFQNYIDEENLVSGIYGMDLDMQLLREKYAKIGADNIFKNDPYIQIKYSLLKLPHLFGLSFRETRDIFVAIYGSISMILMFFLFKNKRYRIFIYLNLLVLLATIIQTLVYQPTLRYSIYYFNSSLLLYGFFLLEFKDYLSNKNLINRSYMQD